MFTREKQLQRLRNNWGKPLEKYRDMPLISLFTFIKSLDAEKEYISDTAWDDLGMDDFFAKLDRCSSGIGQQYLYYQLHRAAAPHEELLAVTRTSEFFTARQAERESTQWQLQRLSGNSSYFISGLVLDKQIPVTSFLPLFLLSSLGTAVSLLLIPVHGYFLFLAIALIILNIAINLRSGKTIYQHFRGFAALHSMISVALSLSKNNKRGLPDEFAALQKSSPVLNSLQKKLGYLVLDKSTLPDMALLLVEYLNMFFLFDVIAYYRSVKYLLKYQSELELVFCTIGRIDMAISIASFRAGHTGLCTPEFVEEPTILAEDMYHPCIEKAVSNSVTLSNSSMLITGSNMAGKTTFIRTFGLNAQIAQTVNIAMAKRFKIPRMIVHTAICRDDAMLEGKSYFFVEIEQILEFIRLSSGKDRHLFLIDEIFRGTSTVERLSAASAVLRQLAQKNCVMVTTHDIELQEMLEDTYRMFHFSERIADEKLFFDYKIQAGPCRSGNAIKLLSLMGYPEEVIAKARACVETLLVDK